MLGIAAGFEFKRILKNFGRDNGPILRVVFVLENYDEEANYAYVIGIIDNGGRLVAGGTAARIRSNDR